MSTIAPFHFQGGTRPLLISMPHVGTHVPADLAARFTDEARLVPDTDWHLLRLYDFAAELGASVLSATHSRYVVDLNRPPDDANLYPGQDTTGLCPVDTFDKTPIYRAAADRPGADEAAARREALWQPYHRQLQEELSRLRHAHRAVALWDAHSIRSVLPRFFEGRLPDINVGAADGASCDPAMARGVYELARAAAGYTAALDARFKGGYITRHYGRPAQGVHAIQLELAQCNYMEEQPPFDYLPDAAAGIQPHLRRRVERVLAFVEQGRAFKE